MPISESDEIPGRFVGHGFRWSGSEVDWRVAGWRTGTTLCVGSVLLVPLDWLAELGLTNSTAAQVVRAMLLLTMLWYVLRTGLCLSRHGFDIGHALAFLAILTGLHAALSSSPGRDFYLYARVLYWILGTVVVYRLSLTGELTGRAVTAWIEVVLLLASIFTISFVFTVADYRGTDAYLVLWCMPVLVMSGITKRTMCILLLGVVAVLMSLKRGAILGLGLATTVYALAEFRPRMSTRRFVGLVLALTVIGVLGGAAVAYRWDALTERLQDTSGSGRDVLYTTILSDWWHADTLHFILGFGPGSVTELTGESFGTVEGVASHSDWMGFAHSYGLLGVFCLLFLHLHFLNLIRSSYVYARSLFPALSAGYVILFLVNIYSGILHNPNALYLGALLGVSSAVIRTPDFPESADWNFA